MKIESAKTFTAPKSVSSKTNLANSGSESASDSVDEMDSGGEFARVLENLTAKKESSDQKPELSKTKEREKDFDSKLDRHSKDNLSPEGKTGDHNNSAPDDTAAAAAAAARVNNDKLAVESEISVPPARAILHIADLERIVSSIRAQSFDGNSQVMITLKNSVCAGLQIKLTTDKDHRVTAELIAANEKVKAQIDARSNELADLLRQRGLKLTSLQTSVGSETGDENKNRQQFDQSEILLASAKPASSIETEGDEQNFEVSETASSYRV